MNSNFSRGGAKPQMIPGGEDVAVMYRGEPKRGLYQLSPTGKALARLVELPHWLADYASENRGANTMLDFFISREFDEAFRDRHGESAGHIFLDPPQEFDAPAVGIDEQIVKKVFWPKLDFIFFNVFEPDYRLVEKWKVSGEQFRLKSKIIQTNSEFEPQLMISLRELRRC
jgi:hypothetical protein